MRSGKDLLDRMVFAVDLPGESVPGIPLVELVGSQRVLIEHHHGVTEYGSDEICVNVSYGQVCICGTGLKLAQMTKEQLVITGSIDKIALIKRRK